MKSILLITWANIKRRKIQTFLVGICIALAALLFSTMIGISLGMKRPFETLYSTLQASHIVMQIDINVDDADEITSWFQQQEEVKRVSAPRLSKRIRPNPIYKNKEITNSVQLREHHGNAQQQDMLSIMEGEAKEYPAPGEIWIPNHWRNNTALSIGDTLMMPTNQGAYPLRISAIVVDAQYANGLANPSPAWVGPGGLAMLFPLKDISYATIGVRLHRAEDTETVWARFNEAYSFKGFSTLYRFFKQVFQIVYQITGGLLLVFAIFGIIVTLIITSSVVNSAIKTDYKMIGMLKTQGFTNLNVISAYLIQFFLITCIAVPFGLLGGYFMTFLIFKPMIAAIGTINFDISLLWPSIGTFFAFLLGILLITYRTASSASQILPVTAIRNNGPPQKSFSGSKQGLFSLRPKSHPVIFLGLRFLVTNKKRSLTMLVGLLFVIFVQLMYVNGQNSLYGIDHNRPAWGFNDSDLSVSQLTPLSQNEEDYFKEAMEDDDRVKVVMKRGFYGATLPAQPGQAPKTIVGIIYDDDLEKIGLEQIEGRHPVFENEISLGVVSSQNIGKSIGDTLELFVEGQLMPYSIVGLYQSLNNLSEGFYMRIEAMREINPLFQLNNYQLKLKRGVNSASFKEDLEMSYGSAFNISYSVDDLGQLKGILRGIQDMMTLISLLFICVLFVTVYNDTVLSIRESQRNLGIFKAIGMTPRQLQVALVVKALIIAAIALIIGVPLSLYILPRALDQLTAVGGLTKFPYLMHLLWSALVIPFIIIITVLSVWISSRRLLHIRPRILVRE